MRQFYFGNSAVIVIALMGAMIGVPLVAEPTPKPKYSHSDLIDAPETYSDRRGFIIGTPEDPIRNFSVRINLFEKSAVDSCVKAIDASPKNRLPSRPENTDIRIFEGENNLLVLFSDTNAAKDGDLRCFWNKDSREVVHLEPGL